VIYLSIIGLCLTGLFGKLLGIFNIIGLSYVYDFSSPDFSISIFSEIIFGNSPIFYLEVFYWINSPLLNLNWSFVYFTLKICLISTT
jgi:hypothetical protein